MKRIQYRSDTSQSLNLRNPILAKGELGIEKDTGCVRGV